MPFVIGAVEIRVDVLVSKEWPGLAKSSRKLRVERGHVVNRASVFVGGTNQETLTEEFDATSYVDEVAVHDGLAQADGGTLDEVADAVVVIRSTQLQTGNRIWAYEEPEINVIAVIFVKVAAAVIVGADGIVGAVFGEIVQA